jgi:hypothetical protein
VRETFEETGYSFKALATEKDWVECGTSDGLRQKSRLYLAVVRNPNLNPATPFSLYLAVVRNPNLNPATPFSLSRARSLSLSRSLAISLSLFLSVLGSGTRAI